jgi:large subunit ribosomal protein L19
MMSRIAVLEEVEKSYLKETLPRFSIGDTVSVQTRILEGEKERLQTFTGIVIARKGSGLSETFTLYRTAYGSSMERLFLLHSPRIAEIAVIRSGRVRRAKLYYLRGKSGKAIKIREQFVENQDQVAPTEQKPESEASASSVTV